MVIYLYSKNRDVFNYAIYFIHNQHIRSKKLSDSFMNNNSRLRFFTIKIII